MTENLVERLWRDSRINMIVEGANEVMHSFVFAYGSKQLGEYMLGVKNAPMKNISAALRIGAELFLGILPGKPQIYALHPTLSEHTGALQTHIQRFSHAVKMMFKQHAEKLITAQMIQARLSWSVTWIHAMACSLARIDQSIRRGVNGKELEDERTIVEYVCTIAGEEIDRNLRGLKHNSDHKIKQTSDVAARQMNALPNGDFAIPEATPDKSAHGSGFRQDQSTIPQFGSGSLVKRENVPV